MMKKLAALVLTIAMVMMSVISMPALAEGTYAVTFCRTQDSTMESDIFSVLTDESYEDNRWSRLIEERLGIDVQYL